MEHLEQPPPILLFVYSLCNGIGSPLLALQWAIESYNASLHHHEPPVEIVQTFIFEISGQANDVAKALLRMAQYPGEMHYLGDLERFHQHACSLPCVIPAGRQYRVLALSGTPCKSISSACRRSPNRRFFGLHASPSNIFWQAHSGLTRLQQDHVAWFWSFAENVIPCSNLDLAELDRHLGHRLLMAVPAGAGAPRNRYVWTTVVADVPPFPTSHGDYQGRLSLPHGWQYLPGSKGLPCVRAIFPYLFWRFAEDIVNMTPADQEVVISCQLWHEATQRIRLPPLEVWAAAMGIDKEVLECMQTVLQCAGEVRSGLEKAPCGSWAYCDPCSEILTLFGEGWHLNLASHFVYHCFTRFMMVSADPLLFQYTVQLNPVIHVCSNSCNLSRKTL